MCVSEEEEKSLRRSSSGGNLFPPVAFSSLLGCADDDLEQDNDDNCLVPVFQQLESIVRPIRKKMLSTRTIYLSRHGESEYNVQERIGGDPALTQRGRNYASMLGAIVNEMGLPKLRIWTSSLRRTILTAAHIQGVSTVTPLLNEINSGSLDGFKYEEMEKKFPEEWRAREADKLRYKYPKAVKSALKTGAGRLVLACTGGTIFVGESYIDCCSRIVPVLMAIERNTDDLIVVSHQAILRCIFGYLLRRPMRDIPYIKIPQHTIMQVTMEGDSNVIEFIRVPVDHIEQGINAATKDEQEDQACSRKQPSPAHCPPHLE